MTLDADEISRQLDPVEQHSGFLFADRYDELIAQPWVAPFYAGSGFFNTGYWDSGVQSQQQACERLIDELARPLPARPSRLLDVGCGLGATTRALQRRLPETEILGINISQRQLSSNPHWPANVGFAAMDASRLALQNDSLDAIVSVEAAFHFNTRLDFFREAERVLKPGGMLVLSDILYLDVAAIGEWMVPAANRITSIETYARQLDSLGFEGIKVTDATQPCWDGFCTSMRNFFQTAHDAGTLDGNSYRGMMQLLDRLTGCVAYYLIASARKCIE